MFSWLKFPQSVHRLVSCAILFAIGMMFIAISCDGHSLQFNLSPSLHAPEQSCQEHTIQSDAAHLEKSIFAGVTLPETKIFLVALAAILLSLVSPKLEKQFTHLVKVVLATNRRKKWVWSRNLPFSSLKFFPYFAAQRAP